MAPHGYDRRMLRRRLVPAALILLGSCTLPRVVEALDAESPPPELGRPSWVRSPARAGSWIGGAIGGLASIVALPVTWPLSQLAEEPLGSDRQEFVWGLTSVGASVGHTIVGAPLDGLDWIFRRAWIDDPSPSRELLEPQSGPVGPVERRVEVEPAATEPVDPLPTEPEPGEPGSGEASRGR